MKQEIALVRKIQENLKRTMEEMNMFQAKTDAKFKDLPETRKNAVGIIDSGSVRRADKESPERLTRK
jgi:hypothetical protein